MGQPGWGFFFLPQHLQIHNNVIFLHVSKGELAISSEMERLQSALFFDNVPETWTKLAYPSTYSLAIWCVCVCV